MNKLNISQLIEYKKQLRLEKYKKNDKVVNDKVVNDKVVNDKVVNDVNGNKIYSIIPLNLFQTWHTLDLLGKMQENVELLKKENPEFTYYLYDDQMCEKFIKDNFDDEILYTFNKLKPGAYKADLWRYCILYLKGGIYLDIKYTCINDFKLIELTDKEYFVKDMVNDNRTGVYQALLCCLPKNNILLECITQVVYNVKHNLYLNNCLDLTGPLLFIKFENFIDIKNLELKHIEGKYIENNNNKILKVYDTYRNEQKKYQKYQHYGIMWDERNIYNYPLLKYKSEIDFSKQINNSSNINIIELIDDQYLIVNNSSINSNFILDKNFNLIKSNNNFNHNFIKNNELIDIKLFKHINNIFYIAIYMNNNVKSFSSGLYDINKELKLKQIENINKQIYLSYFIYNNDLCVICEWYPLQIGKIDCETNKLNIIKILYNTTEYFKDVSYSTNGYTYNNEIWFILNKKQKYEDENKYNSQHFFAVFDLQMNLLRYSELFKFSDTNLELCSSLIIKNNEMILSYVKSIVSIYDLVYIKTGIKWYNNEFH
jgi:mannosyltransferase OCH1-like enzyme